MTHVTIYHNPRCSKSRQTLALLEERGIQPQIIDYLNTPPSIEALRYILTLLGKRPKDILRKGEEEYKTMDVAAMLEKDDAILALMVRYPKLMERPIVIVGNKACLGRPPENVLNILTGQ